MPPPGRSRRPEPEQEALREEARGLGALGDAVTHAGAPVLAGPGNEAPPEEVKDFGVHLALEAREQDVVVDEFVERYHVELPHDVRASPVCRPYCGLVPPVGGFP